MVNYAWPWKVFKRGTKLNFPIKRCACKRPQEVHHKVVKKREVVPQIKVIAVRDFHVQLLLLPTLNLLFSQFSEVGKLDLTIPG